MVFPDVKYFLAPSFPEQRALELRTVLDANGATQVFEVPEATHVISDKHQFEGWHSCRPDTHVVTDFWVDRSMALGKMQAPQHYSTDPAMVFSGVTAAATELPSADLEVLSAGVSALGGVWRSALTKDVTHLFAINSSSDKYATAMHHREQTHMKVLLPHWFDDAVRLAVRNLPTADYEWPEPKILQNPTTSGAITAEGVKKQDRTNAEKHLLYRTALWTPERAIPAASGKNVWQGKTILLSSTWELPESRREAVYAGIRRSGGVVIALEANGGEGSLEEEAYKVDEADVLVTRWRSGRAYIKAMRASKLIGSLSWLFHVQSTGIITMPTTQLLHYPIPKKPIEGFHMHEITVTNYTGDARDYLKRLIHAMGATFTPSMSGRNTVLIAAFMQGTKTDKARSWSIPIVNHTWLEDCFVRWRNLTVGLEKYIVFPEGVDFAVMLGERGLGREVELDADELEAEEEEEAHRERVQREKKTQQAAEERAAQEQQHLKDQEALKLQVEVVVDPGTKRPPLTADTSMRDVREVEDAVSGALLDFDDDPVSEGAANAMDVDEVVQKPPPTPKRKSAMKPKSSPVKATPIKKPVTATPRRASPTPPHTTPRTTNRITSDYSPVIPPLASSSSELDEDFNTLIRRPRKKLVRRSGQDIDLSFSIPNDEVTVEVPSLQKSPAKSPKKAAKPDDSPRRSARKGAATAPTRHYSPLSISSDDEVEGRVNAKKGKGNVVADHSDDGMDIDSPNKRSTRVRRPSSSKLPVEVATKERPTSQSTSSLHKSTDKGKGRARDDDSDTDLDVPKKPGRAKASNTSHSKPDRSANLRSSAQKSKGKGKAPQLESESEEDEDEVESIVVQRKPRSSATSGAPDTSPLTSPAKSSAKTSSKRPQRMTSIIGPGMTLQRIPSPTKPALDSDSDVEPVRPKSPAKPVAHTQTMRSAEAERNRASGSSRTITSGNAKGKEKQEPRLPSPMSTIKPDSSSDEKPAPSGSRARRSAATKARQRLHDEVMPDVMNYEQQMRRARKSGGLPNVPDSRASSAVPNKKKRPSDPESRAEEQEEKEPKKRKVGKSQAVGTAKQTENDRTSAKGKGKARMEPINFESGDEVAQPSKTVRLMTTGVALEDDISKPLLKLGVKFTTKYSECTHLVVSHLVRTEKFLCALAMAPHIITKEWAVDSAKAKTLLDEDQYQLHDKDAEKKFQFKLTESLARARKHKGQLFAKKTFYITSKVPVDLKLLKNVIVAGGGQALMSPPTLRILNANPDRHIISCPNDVSIWRPIAEHHTIYTQEIVLTSSLRQQVDWDADEFKVPGSF
ncbi:hypothetical protein HGRIS_009469 [Hohenbuehelia grisea]|uniref:BRCT domain-containing protein n=1 Tax=Hohenbuehelia grisea TaxID=104357 RepID=A0ABR3J1E7_9AGAR